MKGKMSFFNVHPEYLHYVFLQHILYLPFILNIDENAESAESRILNSEGRGKARDNA